MKTEWDYSDLADAYLKRPDYADSAIDDLLALAGAKPGDAVCDVGAGVAHLTMMLASRGLTVVAVEPNDAMRANGIRRTASFPNVRWHEGTGERTDQPAHIFTLVTFGSSFNVCDRVLALKESARILKPRGWFACMWNHRDLTDPIQAQIESIIKSSVPGYGYGVRREDQTGVITSSRLFRHVARVEGKVNHVQSIAECVEAWRSHATLSRQAGDEFLEVIAKIEAYLVSLEKKSIRIPYATSIWAAQVA